MNQNIDQNLIKESYNQENNLQRSIEILSEMTRADIERSSYYFDINLKLETQSQ